jgi:hypothetical protein
MGMVGESSAPLAASEALLSTRLYKILLLFRADRQYRSQNKKVSFNLIQTL